MVLETVTATIKKSTVFITKEHRYSALTCSSMTCTNKNESTIRYLREIYKITPAFKFKCSYG